MGRKNKRPSRDQLDLVWQKILRQRRQKAHQAAQNSSATSLGATADGASSAQSVPSMSASGDSPGPSGVPSSAREIELLENVELQLGFTKNDEQLTKVVGLFLAPLLLKMGSTDSVVRNKAMGILNHIQARTKSKPTFVLPLDALMNQWQDNTLPGIVKNFNIIYLEQAFQRETSQEKKKAVVLTLLQGIARRPIALQTTLLHIVVPMLGDLPIPDNKDDALEFLGFNKNPYDVTVVVSFIQDVLLYNKGAIPRSLNPAALERLTRNGKKEWSYDELVALKLSVLKFLSKPAVADIAKLPCFIIAACDSHHEVLSRGEDGLKRLLTLSLDNEELVDRLMDLYLGPPASNDPAVSPVSPNTVITAPAATAVAAAAAAAVPGAAVVNRPRGEATPAIKHRIVSAYLSRSIVAANKMPRTMTIISDCLSGEFSNKKLKRDGIVFLQWMIKMGATKTIKSVSLTIFNELMRVLQEPPDNRDDLDTIALRSAAYVSLGQICAREKAILISNTHRLQSTIQLYFNAFDIEGSSVRLAIQEGLSSLQLVVQNPTPEIQSAVHEIMMGNMAQPQPLRRLAAARFALLFPFSDVCSRYVCLVLAGDNTHEVREEAKLGLILPHLRSDSTSIQGGSDLYLPPIHGLLTFIADQQQRRKNLPQLPLDLMLLDAPIINTFTHTTYTEAIKLLRACFFVEALRIHHKQYAAIPTLINALSSVDFANFAVPANVLAALKTFLSRGERNESATLYKQFLLGSIRANYRTVKPSDYALREMLIQAPHSLVQGREYESTDLKVLVLSTREETRDACAHIVAMCTVANSPSARLPHLLQEQLGALLSSKLSSAEQRLAAILNCGFTFGEILAVITESPSPEFASIMNKIAESLVTMLVSTSEISATAVQSSTMMALWTALGAAAKYQPVVPLFSEEQLLTVLESLRRQLAAGKDARMNEKIVSTMGYLCVGTDSTAVIEGVRLAFMEQAEKKNIELHLAIGEAFAVMGSGWRSEALACFHTPSMPIEKQSHLTYIISHLLDDATKTPKAAVKQALCLWLLSIVKLNSTDKHLKAGLVGIHNAFIRYMNERDEFTQECASRGIGIVYELGDDALRSTLIDALVGSLIGNKTVKVDTGSETQLFDENLGTSPSGNEISTYKEICALANELNQPDLVYQFLGLAHTSAMWNSRRGAAFGFASIAATAGERISRHLPKIVPKLYRYRFDPNPKIASTMQTIWKTLVPETKQTVDQFFNEILLELLSCMGNKSWRIREASAMGMIDLLTGRKLGEVEPVFDRVWQMAMRVMDDIKESVRVAGNALCRMLSQWIIRLCDSEQTIQRDNTAERALAIVMPFLLNKGVLSDAEEVRSFSLDTITKLCRIAGPFLRPYVADTIMLLVEALSSLEPQAVNYLSFHVEKYNISKDELDQGRLAATKSSPVMEAIEACLEDGKLSLESMGQVMPRLLSVIRKGVGFPSKAASARVCMLLTELYPNQTMIYSQQLMQALSGAVQDPSSALLRKVMALALAKVSSLASQSAVEKLLQHIRKLYTDSVIGEIGHEVGPMVAVELVRSIRGPVRDCARTIVPVAFIGSFDETETFGNSWSEVLDETASGKQQAIQGHFVGIVDIIEQAIASPSWPWRKQAASALTALATLTNSELLATQTERLCKMLVVALTGPTYPGKETLVSSLVSLVKGAGTSFRQSNAVLEVMLQEVRKKDINYRRVVLDGICKLFDMPEFTASAHIDFATFDSLSSTALDTITKQMEVLDLVGAAAAAAAADVDDARERPVRLLLVANSLRLLGLVWPKGAQESALPADATAQRFTAYTANLRDSTVWSIQVAALDGLAAWLLRVGDPSQERLSESMDLIETAAENARFAAIRAASIRAVLAVLPHASSAVIRGRIDKFVIDFHQRIKAVAATSISSGISSEVLDLLRQLEGRLSGMQM